MTNYSTTLPIYYVSDLIDVRVYDVPADAYVETYYAGMNGAIEARLSWVLRYYGDHYGIADAAPNTVANLLRRVLRRRKPEYGAPSIGAEELAKKVRARRPMTPGALIADHEFAALARRAAEDGKKYTQELLAWEKKAAVEVAVSHFREIVDAERAAEAARRRDAHAAAMAQAERERPTRSAVLEAYGACGYRTARQGHAVRVEFVAGRAGVKSDTVSGERYSSRCTYRKSESVHTLRVREDWLERVRSRNLHLVSPSDPAATEADDFRLVLDVSEAGHTADHSGAVYDLLTVRQGRGTSLETETLRIVRDRCGADRLPRRGDVFVEYSDERVAHDALIDCGLVAC